MENLKKKILKLLFEDARFSYKKIASLLNANEDDVKNIIEELENSGTILKYVPVIDTNKLGESIVEALVEIKVVPMKAGGYDDIARTLVQFDEIKSIFLLSGNFDFAMTVEGKDIKDVAFFVSERLSTLSCVQSTATHFVLKRYKTEGVILKENAINRVEYN